MVERSAEFAYRSIIEKERKFHKDVLEMLVKVCLILNDTSISLYLNDIRKAADSHNIHLPNDDSQLKEHLDFLKKCDLIVSVVLDNNPKTRRPKYVAYYGKFADLDNICVDLETKREELTSSQRRNRAESSVKAQQILEKKFKDAEFTKYMKASRTRNQIISHIVSRRIGITENMLEQLFQERFFDNYLEFEYQKGGNKYYCLK